jgi:hypothetical protein
MKNIDYLKFFSIFGLLLIGLGWLGFLLSLAGFFYAFFFLIFIVLSFIFLVYLYVKNRKIFLDKIFVLVIILSFFAIAIFSFFSTPSVFSGRDQGSFSSAAISLSQNNQLKSFFPAQKEFFEIYGPGKALNFPGFNYDKSGNLITQFPLGYISWLAIFYSIFGVFGLVLANGVAFFLFLTSFYLVSRNYLKPIPSFIAFFLVLTSFIFSWFFKYTLSENLALALIWFGILQFLFFINKKSSFYLFSFLATFGLLLFTRIEGLAFFLIACLILFFLYKKEKDILGPILLKIFLPFSLFLLMIFFLSFEFSSAFYKAFLGGFLNSLNLEGEVLPHINFLENLSYITKIMLAYAILVYLVLGISGFIYFLRKKKFEILIPFIIVLPSFIYLINPSISIDHPWMLRRYVFAVVPASILYTILLLIYFLKNKVYFYVFSLILIITNLLVFVPYIKIKENKNLLPQIEKLSLSFKDNDLILIDRNATGDPWSMMTDPMRLIFKKQAVYFFNPNDLEKINHENFENIYLIIPNENFSSYDEEFIRNLTPIENYVIKTDSLAIATGKKNELLENPVILPEYQENYIYGKIYLFNRIKK